MRGYRKLRAAGQLDRITDTKDALTNASLRDAARCAGSLLLGEGLLFGEAVVRQYLLIRVGFLSLNRALLRSVSLGDSPSVYALPPEWRRVLVHRGFPVHEARSAIAWHGLVLLFWCYGVVRIVRTVGRGCWGLVSRAEERGARYAFFVRLGPANLPVSEIEGQSRDVVTWYARWKDRPAAVDELCHDVASSGVATVPSVLGLPIRRLSGPVPAIEGLVPLLRFTVWGVAATSISLVRWVSGKWAAALILGEAAMASQARFTPPARLARDYLFHNSGHIYRPLWTYEAERKGSRITLYCYSTNFEGFKRPSGYPTQAHSWQAMTWPRYLVWDEYQKEFIRRAVGQGPEVLVVGPIWFATSSLEMPRVQGRSVAVFDVQPRRPSWYQEVAPPHRYYVPEVANAFLDDVHGCVRSCGAAAVFKQKRDIGRLMHRRYVRTVERLEGEPDFVSVPADIDAACVIERCQAVVSIPFTSTALVARSLGRPSVFYDPTGHVQRDDRAAHGIPVLSGRSELEAWLREVLGSPPVHTSRSI